MAPDSDMLVFDARLRFTTSGRLFSQASVEMKRAVAGAASARSRLELRVWQRQYIRASERATQALCLLERDYGWPPSGV